MSLVGSALKTDPDCRAAEMVWLGGEEVRDGGDPAAPIKRAGDIYVEDGCCLLCGVPLHEATDLFGKCFKSKGDASCYVKKQPETADKQDRMFSVIQRVGDGCIRYRGRDRDIQQRLVEAGEGPVCVDLPADLKQRSDQVLEARMQDRLAGFMSLGRPRTLAESLRDERLADPSPSAALHRPRRSLGPYEIVFIVPPIGLQFASFVPLWYFARGLSYVLGIPWNAPVRDQPFGLVWIVVFLTVAVGFMLLGFVLGVLLNALVLRYALGWSWAEVCESGVCPGLPAHWFQDQTAVPIWFEDGGREGDPLYDPQIDGSAWPPLPLDDPGGSSDEARG